MHSKVTLSWLKQSDLVINLSLGTKDNIIDTFPKNSVSKNEMETRYLSYRLRATKNMQEVTILHAIYRLFNLNVKD